MQNVYSDTLTLTAINALNSPQHVVVSLDVQPGLSTSPTPGGQPTATATTVPPTSTPSSGPRIMDIFGANLSFTYTQGQANPASQVVTIANIGGSSFSWQATLPASASSWLSIASTQGTVAATQSSSLVVNVYATHLAPATYSTQLTINTTDSSGSQLQGSPRTIPVTLSVFAPCTLQVTPSSLSFSASLLQPNPSGQPLTIKETGNCTSPVWWKATVDQSWLSLSSTSGSNNSSITVSASAQEVLIGKYTAHITLSVSDSNGDKIQNSPQIVTVTLNVSAL